MGNSFDVESVYPPRSKYPTASASGAPYDPQPYLAPPGYSYNTTSSDLHLDHQNVAGGTRLGARTPSPTPSEAELLSQAGAFDWGRLKRWRFWIRKEWTWYYLIAIVIVTGVALVSLYHDDIVSFLQPAATWMHNLKFGWLIPIAIFFVISFPPLFGHEIVAILCGLVWGLGPGFGIVAAGTFLGEIGNFYAFKWCCRSRGEKLERTNFFYACLARVVRDGGFKIALIARLSAIPGHFTTAIFSTCGMGIITFSIAAILSLPKQFVTVYLGVILEQSSDGTKVSTKDNVIKYVVLGVTTLITIWAVWYMYHEMGKVKVQVVYDRRKARQAKLASGSPYANFQDTSSTAALNPSHDSEVSLNPMNRTQFNPHANFNPDSSSEPYQRWDENGNAVGWAGDPNLMFAPKPSKAVGYMSHVPTERREVVSPQSRRNDSPSEEDLGYQYPMREVGRAGRVVVRQQSDDSVVSEPDQQPDQYEVSRQLNPFSKMRSSASQYPQQPPQLPSMQLTQSDPSPSTSPPTLYSSRQMAGSASVPGSSSASQYQYDSSRQYQPPPLPSMSPVSQSTPTAIYYQHSSRPY